jgi:N-acyl homoserine lactone hydrolase
MGTKIKAMKVAQYGVDLELLVFPHPEIALTKSRQEGHKVWYRCPSLAYVIDHPEGLILWETSLSENFSEDWPEPWQQLVDLDGVSADDLLEAHLKRAGLGPEDFRYVIMGHLHCDHAGGLRLFEHAPAEIICHEDELRHVMSLEGDQEFYIRSDTSFLARKRPITVCGDMEILRDLTLHSLPGHTPGTIGLSTRLSHCGWMLLASDAIYTHTSYGPPPVGSSIVWDREEWRRSVEKLRRIANATDALLLPGHDTVGIRHQCGQEMLESVELLPDGYYE